MIKHLATTALASLLLLPASGLAAAPTPDNLLPADTLLMVTVPDCLKFQETSRGSATGKLWNDPAMQPFVRYVSEACSQKLLKPMSLQLGVDLNQYTGLVQGQITLAVVANGWEGSQKGNPDIVIIVDTKGKQADLSKALAEIRNKWIDSGKAIRKQQVRGVEFSTITVSSEDLGTAVQGAFGVDKPEPEEERKIDIAFAQSESLLLIGNRAEAFEKVLVRQAGGLVSPLAESPNFRAVANNLFRDAGIYGWADAKKLIGFIMSAADQQSAANQGNQLMPLPPPSSIFKALGVSGIESLSMAAGFENQGEAATLYVQVPEGSRTGLLKAFLPEARDASPPPFVPADVSTFTRMRVDWKAAWNTIEGILTELSPQAAGMFQLMIGMAGKDQDPNFDIRRDLIGNLGNDVITFQKQPAGDDLQSAAEPASLYMISSPNPAQLASAIKMVSSSIPGGQGMTEREFLGRKVYSFPIPSMNPDGTMGQNKITFAPSGNYLAISSHVNLLEDYLRNPEAQGKALRETPGLYEAAQKVGGLNSGWFSYENPTETGRIVIDSIRKDPDAFEKLISANMAGMPGIEFWDAGQRKEWVDFTLLPPFEKIRKYFGYSVSGISPDAQGVAFKVYSPLPPALK